MAEAEISPTMPPGSSLAGSRPAPGRPDRRALGRAAANFWLFVAQRLGFGLLVLLAIIFLIYFGLDMAGGSELGPAASQAVSRTVAYLGRLAQGDLGLTTAGSETMLPVPVPQVVGERLPRSLGLLAVSLLTASLTGAILGIVAARGRSERSLAIILSTLIGVSVPSFFAAFILQWIVINLTRVAGRSVLPVGGFGWDNHLILPALVLAARPVAQITRITFVSVRQVIGQDFVRTARSKGLRSLAILADHILRNAAIPILTTVSVSLRFSLCSLPVVEYYFGWPGAGLMLLKSIAQRDDNLTVALTLCLGLLFILVNLILELCYRIIDPRLWDRPARVAFGERQKLLPAVKSALTELKDLTGDNPLVRWLRRRRARPAGPSSVRQLGPPMNQTGEVVQYRRPSLGRVLRTNLPFTLGSLLVLALLAAIFVGPRLAPHDPYRTQGLVFVDGQLSMPPFAPGGAYPWGTDAMGRDMLSLLLSGAQQTLLLAILAVAARTVVGVVLGAIAGWTNGSRLDRLIVGTAEVISAIPTLLLAMILILALNIRLGLLPFVLGLCFVGWGEIMQFVRGEVTAIRPKPFIEGAVSVGARTPHIISRHVLPNLFSALISIVALEMGAVLMLLGELGFIGIFIGGGAYFDLSAGAFIYSDVPEWGALLANVRYQARPYPWTALYPMLAFFVAILTFNLVGEGVRRLVEEGNLIINRILNRYTITLAVIGVVGLNWLSTNSGAMPYHKDYAREFDGQRALEHVVNLTDPALEGRALGTAGMDLAADYIAAEFQALGLQAAGQKGTFFQERKRGFERLEAVPELTIADGGPPLVPGQDYAAYRGLNLTHGEGSGPLRLIVLGRRSYQQLGGWHMVYPDLYRAAFPGEIILTLSDAEARTVTHHEKAGLLVLVDDPAQLTRRYTLSSRSRSVTDLYSGEIRGYEVPSLWISPATADRLLASAGLTAAEMKERVSELGVEQVLQVPLPVEASLRVQGSLEPAWPVRNVLGYIPGSEGFDLCQDCLGKQLIVVMAQYDSPPIGPEGVYQAANNNASGVAVMLEAIRVLQETDYRPPKTMLFVAYSGEGLDGGEPVSDSDIAQFLAAKTGFATETRLEAVVQLRGLGGGTGDRLLISAGSSLRLAELVERAAREMGTDTVRSGETIDIGVIYEDQNPFTQGGQEAPMVRVYWEGWEATCRLASDTLEVVSAENLAEAGRSVALTLMILGRETNY